QINFHQAAALNTGILQGSGILAQGGNLPFMALDNSSLVMLRGDLNAFKEGWAGSHEFAVGFLLLPRSLYQTENDYLNNGFILEERKLIDPNNAAAGNVP